MTGSQTLRAGNATALAASSRCAAPPLRCGPSGDTTSAAANGLATTGRVLPVVTDRLFHTTTAGASTMPLTSPACAGKVPSSRASTQSEYTLFSPSDCPTNQDHLTRPSSVLIGEDTYKRRWVSFEIEESIRSGMGLVGVYIHKLQDQNGASSGLIFDPPNPLDNHEV